MSTRARARAPRQPAQADAGSGLFAALTMNAWSLRHLRRLYVDFRGDFVAAMVLGEVTHHNLAVLVRRFDYSTDRIRAHLATPEGWRDLLPSNAFSVAEALELPRETVRRKVALLVRDGLLVRRGRSDLFLSPDPAAYAAYSHTTHVDVVDLLATAAAIRSRGTRR